MKDGIGIVLAGIGGLWAILGVSNIVSVASNNAPLLAVALIFNVAFFLIPGLVAAGFGVMLLKRSV